MADLECKIAEQLGNEHGMSSGFLCVRLCWDKELFVLKILSQISQRNWGFSSWVLKCLDDVVKSPEMWQNENATRSLQETAQASLPQGWRYAGETSTAHQALFVNFSPIVLYK